MKTVQEIRTFLQSYLHRTLTPQRHPDLWQHFVQLFQQHPTWKTRWEEICAVKILRSKVNQALLLRIKIATRTKRPWQTISWRKCTERPQKPRNSLDQAMRYAIRRQITQWKNTHGPAQCASCAKTTTLEVDHIIPFCELKQAFLLTSTSTPPTQFGYATNCYMKFLTDTASQKFCKAWQRYHRRKVQFQFLCKSCNLSKGKKP